VNIRLLLATAVALVAFVPVANARIILVPASTDEARAFIADLTNQTYDSAHGMQVQYNGANHKSYLWSPGNTEIVRGQWKVARNGKSIDVCFKYASDWACQPVESYIDGSHLVAQGDPLGLSKNKAVPHVLTRKKETLPGVWAAWRH